MIDLFIFPSIEIVLIPRIRKSITNTIVCFREKEFKTIRRLPFFGILLFLLNSIILLKRLAGYYPRTIGRISETTKRIANTIVILKTNFSKPRLLLNVTPPSFPDPKAPPIPASDF